ncbi:hypothetical protein [uncultured Sphingomonas sp.]|uniref:hypothetical protein n=1 Tax=Sphingomonas sp. 179-A 2A2 NHS TaxID=3374290 RepID=UPI0025E0D5AF|nr:hypothetical protein [uncultured Sphingomonas sp.]
MSETADQAATRRRWISLAEIVAVSGVIIGALTLWMNWSERRSEAQEKVVAAQAALAAEARLALHAELADGGKEVRLTDPAHDLLETTIRFPTALAIREQRPATPRIERDWFADAVLKATDGGADKREGRLPVLVSTRYRVGDKTREGQAIVDVVWRTNGRLIGGRTLSIESAQVREPGGSVKRIDALWKAALGG